METHLAAVEHPSKQDRLWLERALENARKAAAAGGSPFGAVVAAGAQLLGEGGNETVASASPIRHAEIVAIEAAVRKVGGELPPVATLYSSCAPCIMCLGAAFYAGLRRAVYALDIADVIPLGSGDPPAEPTQLNEFFQLGFSLIKGPQRREALAIVQDALARRGHL